MKKNIICTNIISNVEQWKEDVWLSCNTIKDINKLIYILNVLDQKKNYIIDFTNIFDKFYCENNKKKLYKNINILFKKILRTNIQICGVPICYIKPENAIIIINNYFKKDKYRFEKSQKVECLLCDFYNKFTHMNKFIIKSALSSEKITSNLQQLELAVIRIIDKCNHKCLICHEEDYKNVLMKISLSDFKTAIKCIEKNNYKSIIISGGEPTLHKNLLLMIKFAIKKNKTVILISNGSKLSYLYKQLNCITSKNFFIFISIYSFSRDTHKKCTQVDNFLDIWNSIIHYENLQIYPKIIIYHKNIYDLYTTILLLYLNGYKKIILSLVAPKGSAKNNNSCFLAKKDYLLLVNQFKLIAKFKIDFYLEGFPNSFLKNNFKKLCFNISFKYDSPNLFYYSHDKGGYCNCIACNRKKLCYNYKLKNENNYEDN